MVERLKVEELVKPVEALLAEKQAIEQRITDLMSTLNTALNKLGFQVVPLPAGARPGRRRARPPAVKAETKPGRRRGRQVRKTGEAEQRT